MLGYNCAKLVNINWSNTLLKVVNLFPLRYLMPPIGLKKEIFLSIKFQLQLLSIYVGE